MSPAYGAARRARNANQLDLFSSLPLDLAEAVAPGESQRESVRSEHGKEEPVARNDRGPLAGALPQMVEELLQSDQLEQAISEAETRTADLLYELLSVRQMDYQEAWVQATREWAFPPTEAPR